MEVLALLLSFTSAISLFWFFAGGFLVLLYSLGIPIQFFFPFFLRYHQFTVFPTINAEIPNVQFQKFHFWSESIEFEMIHPNFRWNSYCCYYDNVIFNDVIKDSNDRWTSSLLLACKMCMCMHSAWSDIDDWFAMHYIFRFLSSIWISCILLGTRTHNQKSI